MKQKRDRMVSGHNVLKDILEPPEVRPVSDAEVALAVTAIPPENFRWQTNCCTDWEGPAWRVFDSLAIERAFALRSKTLSYADRTRAETILTNMRSRGEHRKLATIRANWRVQLKVLEAQFPNFKDVIHYLRAAYALAEKKDRVPRLSPILLNGPPGVGKSFFASVFAGLLGSGFVTVRMEAAQTASALTGSEEHWGNTKPGKLFSALVEQEFANLLVFVDEVDKACGGDHDPLKGLFALLEPSSAATFADLSYPWIILDASYVVWVCTSNEAGLLPAPILDRMRRFDIQAPTLKQTRWIVQRIFGEILAEIPGAERIKLSTKAIDALSALSPRRIRQALQEAVGRVVYEGRVRILQRDICPDSPAASDMVRRRVGFLP